MSSLAAKYDVSVPSSAHCYASLTIDRPTSFVSFHPILLVLSSASFDADLALSGFKEFRKASDIRVDDDP